MPVAVPATSDREAKWRRPQQYHVAGDPRTGKAVPVPAYVGVQLPGGLAVDPKSATDLARQQTQTLLGDEASAVAEVQNKVSAWQSFKTGFHNPSQTILPWQRLGAQALSAQTRPSSPPRWPRRHRGSADGCRLCDRRGKHAAVAVSTITITTTTTAPV